MSGDPVRRAISPAAMSQPSKLFFEVTAARLPAASASVLSEEDSLTMKSEESVRATSEDFFGRRAAI